MSDTPKTVWVLDDDPEIEVTNLVAAFSTKKQAVNYATEILGWVWEDFHEVFLTEVPLNPTEKPTN